MEEANSAHRSAPPTPPPAPPPAQNPAPSSGVYTPTKKKRKSDDAEFQASKYWKIRSILKGLRPSIIDPHIHPMRALYHISFLLASLWHSLMRKEAFAVLPLKSKQILRSPDYHVGKCADIIRKDLKLIMELSKQLRAETVSLGKMRRLETVEDIPDCRQEEKITEKPALEKPPPEENVSANEETVLKKGGPFESYLIGGPFESYLIGGSPDACNFITYPGSDPVYCGKVKASVTARREPAQS